MLKRLRNLCVFGLGLFLANIALAQNKAATTVNDVSRLNPIQVRRVCEVHDVDDVRAGLKDAVALHLKVSIAGKRHSQGGQTAHRDGIVLDMTHFNQILRMDRQQKLITVQSGVTWEQVQSYANNYGLAVEVQQASNIFTVGGSISVNAHGRDPNFGPIIQSVRSLRLMRADGSIVNVSRSENPALFSLVIGGYGLFGVILDADLQLTENDVYEKHQQSMSYTSYVRYFMDHVKGDSNVGLEYAWPSIRRKDLLQHLVVYTFVRTGKRPRGIFDLQQEKDVEFDRSAFAMSRHSEVGKDVRWFLQETVGDLVSTRIISRNNAMRPPIKFLAYDSPTDTDILQEYFVPVENLVSFMDEMRSVVVADKVNLLSVTIRYVPKDTESFLAYARKESFAFVLYVNQELSSGGRAAAQGWTQKLVDTALRNGGTYYLPYQQYPTREQIRMAYPMVNSFVAKKTEYDPDSTFSSSFYEKYLAPEK
ncbi:MAG: FAD-binding oxidoreductase [Terriglobales bacterium]